MSIGFNFVMMLKKRKQTRCQRCCLSYDNSLSKCPHCFHLEDNQLSENRSKNQKKIHNMGKLFIVFSLILFFFLLISLCF